jgi:hypothetical protein
LHCGALDAKPLRHTATPQLVLDPGILQVARFVPSQKPPQSPEPWHAGRPLRGAPSVGVQTPIAPG